TSPSASSRSARRRRVDRAAAGDRPSSVCGGDAVAAELLLQAVAGEAEEAGGGGLVAAGAAQGLLHQGPLERLDLGPQLQLLAAARPRRGAGGDVGRQVGDVDGAVGQGGGAGELVLELADVARPG